MEKETMCAVWESSEGLAKWVKYASENPTHPSVRNLQSSTRQRLSTEFHQLWGASL